MSMNSVAIIYHKADFDGQLSREVCLHHLQANQVIDVGWDYGQPLPDLHWENFDQIYIVDLSVDELMARPELQPKIVWIDHHASAIKKWASTRFSGFQLDGVAACRLCWSFFSAKIPALHDFKSRKVEEPHILTLAGEYDVWDLHDTDSEDLQFGLRSLDPCGFSHFVQSQLCCNAGPEDVYLKSVVSKGDVLRRYAVRTAQDYAKENAIDILFHGYKMCALNSSISGSTQFEKALKPHHDACFLWRFRGDKKVVCSLYHAKGKELLDLSVIAVHHGGGGHRGACGFTTDLEDLACILSGQ